jgi:hypothetical protein
MTATQPTEQQLTPAEIRLAQYADRGTWTTATYNDGTQKALHEIALGLKAEVDRLRAQSARARALTLLEAANFLQSAHFQDGLSVQEIGTALRHTADEADPMVGSLARDGFGADEIAEMLSRPAATEEKPTEACGKCKKPFDPTDTRHDGQARHGVTSFCRRCVDRCHESTDAFHECVICR